MNSINEGKNMLELKEFDFLKDIASKQEKYSQREIAEKLSISLGKANQIVNNLIDKQLVVIASDNTYQITSRGIAALEPYRVKNAIIMAAGMSSRFAPLSYEKPKGLLKVKGEILIEREIRQLQAAGIEDITVVVGYMKEKFFYLEEQFGVRIVVNEDYYRFNNTSTLIRVLERLSNTYICSSDNYFVDNVFEAYVYQAYYSSVYAAGETDEYCLECDTRGRIKNVTIGGTDSWYMLGHVYFDHNFSKQFMQILKREYEKDETKLQLWENLYMRYIKELDLHIRKYDADKVLEFDSLDELRAFDQDYINNADSKIMKNICQILDCETKDIINIKAIKAGLTNTSFSFTVKNEGYVYRHPGRGTENYINRISEAFSMKVAAELKLDDTFIYMDEKEGWKISYFIENAREMNYHNASEVAVALSMMRSLHEAGKKSEYDFDIWKRALEFVERLKNTEKSDFEGFQQLKNLMTTVYEYVQSDSVEKCLCHCDCYSPNFLLNDENKMYLIDWEYSGNDDPASDLGTFICCADYTFEEALQVIEQYLQHDARGQELAHFLAYVSIASYYWYLWALYQETMGKNVGEYLYIWYKNSKLYAKRAIELYQKEED